MLLTKPQRDLFWSLWAQACRYQGWTREKGLNASEIDQKRKALLRQCGFSSLTEVDRKAGFGLVKGELQALCDSVQGAVEAGNPILDDARRKKNLILTELLPCLRLYRDDPIAYVEEILREKFSLTYLQPIGLDDLDPRPRVVTTSSGLDERASQLDQALMTITARLHALRKAAGNSIHDMRLRAHLACSCARCRHEAAAARNVAPAAGSTEPF